MASSLFTLTCEKLESATFVGFRGKEQVCRPYEYELFFTVPTGTSVRAIVGERATVKADRRDGMDPLAIHGVIASVRMLHQMPDRALYGALLVPRLWLLRHFWRSYVFTGKKVKDFLSDTLLAGGLVSTEFRFDIDGGAYPEEEFVAQYRESHLDFFHRWLEREGLYYYFEHKPDEASEVLVIVDDKGHCEDFPGGGRVRYAPLFGDAGAVPDGLHQIESDVRWLPKSVTLADYDYANPSVALRSDSNVTAQGVGTIREYGYRAFVDKDLKRLAQVKAEAIGCRETTLRGSGNALGPRAGYRFKIDECPTDVAEEWLAIEVELQGTVTGTTSEVATLTRLSTTQVFEMKLLAVPSDVQYRAPQTTVWPRIYGFENGMICGEADSPYAQIDGEGRYLIRFEFDTSDLPDAKVSTRVRMLQPHGGANEGFHFPLRKGTEVMIAFLGGDPDRPFIAGVVPNAHKPSVVGERNHTQNIIRTGSNNQIVMEDQQGKEFIFMHTPNKKTGIYIGHPTGEQSKVYTGEGESDSPVQLFTTPSNADPASDATMEGVAVSLWQTTEGNAGLYVGGASWTEVAGNESTFVKGNVSHGYRGNYSLVVGTDTSETYHGFRSSHEKNGWYDTVEAGGKNEDITPYFYQNVHGNGRQTVDEDWEHKVTGKNTDTYGTWQTDVKDGTWTATIKGMASIESTSAGVIIKGSSKIDLQAPEVTIKGVKIKTDSGNFFAYSPAKHEFYAYKGATGVAKTDHAVIYQSAYGLKLDTAGIKVENSGAKKTTFGAMSNMVGVYQMHRSFGVKMSAAEVWNGLFKKT